jgi:pyruvate,water dikinase
LATFYWLNQIQPDHLSRVGNKAFYLSRLLQKGYPVVPGFVVPAQMFREFLETIDWLEPLFADLPNSSLHLDIENPQQLRTISKQIRRAIESSPLPSGWAPELLEAAAQLYSPVLALRPSLALQKPVKPTNPNPVLVGKSSALFNLQVCQTSEGELVKGLKSLWAEFFGAKSLFYWQRLGIPLQQVRLAVLVQPLWSAIAAGTVQTQRDSFEVRSSNGLGMAITWGEVIPDTHQIGAKDGAVQIRRLGSRTIAYQVKNQTTSEGADSQEDAHFQQTVTQTLPPTADNPHPPAPQDSVSQDGQNPLILTPHTSPMLQAYLLSEEQQKRPVLNDQQLGDIVQLTQRIVAEIGIPVDLEWTMSRAGSSPMQLYVTQLIPKLPLVTNQEKFYQPDNQAPDPAATTKMGEVDEIPAGSHLLLTGLAAAGGKAIARAKVIQPDEALENLQPGTILVTRTMLPQWLLLIKQAAAIVTEQGTMTSHCAIVARELGVPAVMGARNATEWVQTGDLLMVDGSQGNVYWIDESSAGTVLTNREARRRKTANEGEGREAAETQRRGNIGREDTKTRGNGNPETTKPISMFPSLPLSASSLAASPIRTQLMVNVSQLESLERLANLPIDGVGLLRSELLAIALFNQKHPKLWSQKEHQAEFVGRLAESLRQFAAALMPRPVYYRSLDLRSHEFRELSGGEPPSREVNPMLGMRGTFSYVINPTLFDLELDALLQVQQSGYQNVHLMLPFVRTVEEFRFCHQRIVQKGLKRSSQFQLWIMAEVPSVLFLIPEYVQAGVQGISIGTNDLTQLLLGVDRDDGQMATAFEATHPAVKAAIAHLIQQAKQAGIPCSICGQAPSRSRELIEDLVRWGITSISVEPDAVESTFQAIAHAEQRMKGEV